MNTIYDPDHQEKKFYEKEYFIVLMLIFIFPLGIYLTWKYSKWSQGAKIAVTIVGSVIFLGAASGVADGKSFTKTSSRSVFSRSEYEFSIKSYFIDKNFDGSPVIVIKYNYTNNSDEPKSFAWACHDRVYQNGVECDSLGVICDSVSAGDQLKEVQPGAAFSFNIGYKLNNKTSPVDVVIQDYWKKKTLLEDTIRL